MSSYDLVDRADDADVTVRVYCEVPMDTAFTILMQVGSAAAYLSLDDAVRIATALLNAVAKAKHAARVDAVVAGRR